jgi:hypothetical protein
LADSHAIVARVAGLTNQPFDAMFVRHGTSVNLLLSGVTEGFFEVLGLPPVVYLARELLLLPLTQS